MEISGINTKITVQMAKKLNLLNGANLYITDEYPKISGGLQNLYPTDLKICRVQIGKSVIYRAWWARQATRLGISRARTPRLRMSEVKVPDNNPIAIIVDITIKNSDDYYTLLWHKQISNMDHKLKQSTRPLTFSVSPDIPSLIKSWHSRSHGPFLKSSTLASFSLLDMVEYPEKNRRRLPLLHAKRGVKSSKIAYALNIFWHSWSHFWDSECRQSIVETQNVRDCWHSWSHFWD